MLMSRVRGPCILHTKIERGNGKGKIILHKMLMAHAHKIAGHLGLGKTDKLLQERFYWKNMTGSEILQFMLFMQEGIPK